MLAYPAIDTAALPPRRPRATSALTAAFTVAAAALSAGCAAVAPAVAPPAASASVATQWHAPLPHGGQLADLSRWWAQFGDPLMLRLIEAAQTVSPTLAQASARIADARAARVARRAALLPALDATASASRGRTELGTPAGTATSAGLQFSWELDLFGAGRAGADAAQARLASTEADWHAARVSVAAEVATTYVELRACEAQLRQSERDHASRARTTEITRLAADAGFRTPASADLATAEEAQGKVVWTQQRARCDLMITALNALTAQDEAALRRELAANTGRMPQPVELHVAALPAHVLAQRPDLHAAAHEVAAASADSQQARAERWPRIALTGNIGTTRMASGGVSTDGTVWSIGPITITLPLFDGGTRQAHAVAARARYETATVVYAARVREAVREVQTSLITLDSTAQRSEDAARAAGGFERSFRATEASYEAGMASLFELEDARRSMVTAQNALIELQRDRVAAWIALYRALGGGWSAAHADAAHDDIARQ